MVDSITFEDLNFSVIKYDWEVNDKLPDRLGKHGVKPFVEIKIFGGYRELFAGHLKNIYVLAHARHQRPDPWATTRRSRNRRSVLEARKQESRGPR